MNDHRKTGVAKKSPDLATSVPRVQVSIITVVLNGEKYIEDTIRSVLNQTYKNVENIIIDGGSIDGTLDIIQKYSCSIDHWISEPDKGIYDAMNKGIGIAKGEWLYFLGAGDRIADDITLATVVPLLTRDTCILFGKIKYKDSDVIVSSRFGIRTLLHNTVHHQSAFYHMSLFKEWKYDDSLMLISDYELNLKIYLKKLPFIMISEIIAICDDQGKSRKLLKVAYKETNYIRKKYFSPIVNIFLKILYFLKFKLANV